MLEIILDGICGEEYEIALTERPSIPTPKRKITKYEIEGRHGSLTELGEYEDIEIHVSLNLLEDENIKYKIRRIKAWLLNSKELSFSDEDIYYKIKHTSIGDIENEVEEYGIFTVTFTLDPFAYLYTQPIQMTTPKPIFNDGTVESEPLIKVYGSGNIELLINNDRVKVSDVSDYVVLDCSLKDCYKGTQSLNNKMIGMFPSLKPGMNEVSWSGTVSKVEIDGRWRML